MRAAFWCAAVLAFALSAVEADAVDPKRVLLLHSFGRDFAPFSEITRSFHAELVKRSQEPLDFYDASVFTARFREPENEDSLVNYLQSLFAGRKLDLIIALGGPAASFVKSHRQRLFSDTPMVIAGVDSRLIDAATLTGQDTYIGVQLDLPAFVENILRVRPETTNIAVVIGNSPNEQFWAAELRHEFQSFANRVQFTWLNALSLDDMLRQIAGLKPHSAVLYFMLAVDGVGAAHPLDEAFARIRQVATVPLFGYGDYHLGQGSVGGPSDQTQALGHQTADVALRILGGESPMDIRIPPLGLGTPAYDWRELQRWGISEARLPPGSIVNFRQPGLWQQYRWQILLVTAVVLAQGLAIFGLLVEHRRRRLAEMESRRHLLEVMHLNRLATAGEMSASIAHEINQPLAAIVTSANASLRWLANRTPDLQEISAALKRIVSDGHRASQVIESIRNMVKKDAQEGTLNDINDLIREVLALLRIELEDHQISARSALTDGLPRVLADRTQLQQVVLNLVRNAIEAMSSVTDGARILRVRTEASETGEVLIDIEDSGAGIDPNNLDRIFEPFFTTKPQGMGMGLSICRSIVESYGGRLWASPGHPSGTVFHLVLPTTRAEGG